MATAAQVNTFIATIAPIIQKYCKLYGYTYASPIIAQACCESAYGTSSLGYKYHNYFGMKCGSSYKGASVNLRTKEEYTVGVLTTIKDNFRVYASMDEGVKGYFEFIKASRYAKLKTAKSPQHYLELLKAAGYATSSTYVNTNMTIIKKYNLTRFDYLDANSTASISEAYTAGKTYKLQANMYVRSTPGGTKKNFRALTANAQKCGYADSNGKGILKKGTAVTCKEVVNLSGAIWIRIPSGYVCARTKEGKVYIK